MVGKGVRGKGGKGGRDKGGKGERFKGCGKEVKGGGERGRVKMIKGKWGKG